MRIVKRLLALGAAVAAMAVFAAPASAAPPPQASCSGIVTSDAATSGAIAGGVIADNLHEVGHEVFVAFNLDLAHHHGLC
jgi:hypothetical protein